MARLFMTLFEQVLERYQPDFCAAYGSGVIPQAGYSKNPMVDFMQVTRSRAKTCYLGFKARR